MHTYLIEQGNARGEERLRQDLREAERERREAERERCEAEREAERAGKTRNERDDKNQQLFAFAISSATKALEIL